MGNIRREDMAKAPRMTARGTKRIPKPGMKEPPPKRFVRDPLTGLTAQQECYAKNLAAGMTSRGAARLAYPNTKRDAGHDALAARLNMNPLVAARVASLRQQISERFVVGEARVVMEAAVIALANPHEAMNRETGQWLPFEDWPEHLARAVSSIEIDASTGKLLKVRFWSKTEMLDKIFRKLGLYAADNVQRLSALAQALSAISAATPGPQDLPPPPDDTKA